MTKLNKVIPEKQQSFKEVAKAKIYPTFYLDSEDLPDLMDWKVGEKYTLVMEVEEIAMRQGQEWQGEKKDNKVKATFKVLKVGVQEKEEDSYEMEYAKKRSGNNNLNK